jgi:hypothetical protein
MLLIGGFWIGDAKSSNGNQIYVATQCIIASTGQILGQSNDCIRVHPIVRIMIVVGTKITVSQSEVI